MKKQWKSPLLTQRKHLSRHKDLRRDVIAITAETELVVEVVELQEPQKLVEAEDERYTSASDVDEDKKEGSDHIEIVKRRSTGERTHPKRLTYPSLGNPLVKVMQSLLRVVLEAFTVDPMPCISQLRPDASEMVQ